MTEIKKRGRKPRDPNAVVLESDVPRRHRGSNIVIIRDPLIEPFYISKDKYGYTIFEEVTVGENKYNRALGHYSDFYYVIKALAKSSLGKEKEYSTIKSYLDEFKQTSENIKKLLDIEI